MANVWQHIPRDGHVYHDVRVAQIARLVAKEIEKLDGYELKFLEFEHYLKTFQKNEKGLCFPDILLGFARFDDVIILDIEIDCGSISRADFKQKINSFSPTILLVCNSPKRLDLLYKYLQQMETDKNVYLTTVEQLKREGFFRGRWLSYLRKAWVTLGEDNVKRRLV